tara:strand:+ start:6161 stop:6502 length:342 start_codon:yes stop_codon:yes gene_type:complete
MNISVTDQIPGDALDAIRSTVEAVDLSEMTDALGETATAIFDSAGDLVGTASEVTVHGGRLVVRGLLASGRTVRNNPRTSFSIVALLLVALGGMKWAASRKNTDVNGPLKVAA